MTTICKAILSGATPRQIRDRTEGLVPARLRDLAVQLAGLPDLTVCVITCDDGTQELEVLHTGPPAPRTPSTAAGSAASPRGHRPGRCPSPARPTSRRPSA